MGTLNLTGHAALVTGAGAGVARAVALALARAGAAVLVNDVNPDRAEGVAAAIQADGGRALPWTADLSNRFQVGAMIERLRDEFSGLHVVVNGWRVNRRGPLLTLDEYDWRRVIEINLTGAFFVGQLAARVMADEGGGVIVYLTDAATGSTEQAPYLASQAAVAALARAMAAELAAQGVRVEAVSVGDNADAAVEAVLRAVRGLL